MKTQILFFFLGILLLSSCRDRGSMKTDNPKEYTPEERKQFNADANTLFDAYFDEMVDRSPVWQSYLGIKKDYGKWDDMSEEYRKADLEVTKKYLEKVSSIEADALDEQTTLSLKLFEKELSETIENYEWRHYSYPVNQMWGFHTHIPSFLINIHKVESYDDALAYLDRLEGSQFALKQFVDNLKLHEEKNVIPPKFVFPKILDDCNNILKGYPFQSDKTKKSTIYKDFETKVKALDIDEEKKKTLLLGCEKRLMTNLQPGYNTLINYVTELEKKATEDDGVWKFKKGDAYFNHRLKRITTTNLTADEIHQLGLEEVKRIHGEMEAIKTTVGFDGDLQAFFKYLRDDSKFYYPNTPAGKEAYMKEATAIIDNMREKLDDLFITKPKADIIVKAVEPFREKSAGKAFYQDPAPDGSRPGTYYANTYNMKEMPKYQMEALAYHEGIPGHHMQLSIAQEMETLPKFRRYGGDYTAYIEGWGLYSEYIPKEFGFYKDPYSDFGRLAMELWRACRLVVDTGIHSKKWTRKQGIDYYKSNTPNAEGDCIKMVDRHIVMPGQATAYKIGMIKIIELKDKASKALQDKFDIREFHDVVLTNGAVPLDVLEDLVDVYISSKNTPQ